MRADRPQPGHQPHARDRAQPAHRLRRPAARDHRRRPTAAGPHPARGRDGVGLQDDFDAWVVARRHDPPGLVRMTMTAHDDHRRFDISAASGTTRPHARERADMIAAAIRDTVPPSPAMRAMLEVGGRRICQLTPWSTTSAQPSSPDSRAQWWTSPADARGSRYARSASPTDTPEHDDLPTRPFDLVLNQRATMERHCRASSGDWPRC